MGECNLCLSSQTQTFVDFNIPLDDTRTFGDVIRLHLPFVSVS